jgi:hypothetical protein
MLTYLRYALATFCFAASVGCLALWWRSYSYSEFFSGPSVIQGEMLYLHALRGTGTLGTQVTARAPQWKYGSRPRAEVESADSTDGDENGRRFGAVWRDSIWAINFPVLYPALVFALAGVAALRLGRRFTLRSALIATTVVAGLLGMAVGM